MSNNEELRRGIIGETNNDNVTNYMSKGSDLHNIANEAIDASVTYEQKKELMSLLIEHTMKAKAANRKSHNNNEMTFLGENEDGKRSSKRHRSFYERKK